MTAPTVYIKNGVRRDGKPCLLAGIADTDEATGVEMSFGPLRDGLSAETIGDHVRSALTEAVLNIWTDINGEDSEEALAHYIAEAKEKGARVTLTYEDGDVKHL